MGLAQQRSAVFSAVYFLSVFFVLSLVAVSVFGFSYFFDSFESFPPSEAAGVVGFLA